MTTRGEAEALVGKYVEITWTETDGSLGAMSGWLWKIDTDPDGTEWVVVDYGYGAKLSACAIREEEPLPGDRGPFLPDEREGATA